MPNTQNIRQQAGQYQREQQKQKQKAVNLAKITESEFLEMTEPAIEQAIENELSINEMLEQDRSVQEPDTDTRETASDDDVDVDDATDDERLTIDSVEDRPYERTRNADNDFDPMVNIAEAGDETFTEHLLNQLRECDLDSRKYQLVVQLICLLNQSGFLPYTIETLKDKIEESPQWVREYGSVDDDELAEAVALLRSFTPTGVGSKDVRDFWLAQIDALPDSDPDRLLLAKMVKDHYELIEGKKRDRLAKALAVDSTRVEKLLKHLHELSRLPSAEFATDTAVTLSADFKWDVYDDHFQLVMCGKFPVSVAFQHRQSGKPDGSIDYGLHIKGQQPEADTAEFDPDNVTDDEHTLSDPTDQTEMLSIDADDDVRETERDKANKATVQQWYIDSAIEFIQRVRVRRQTLLNVMLTIIHYQEDFFFNGLNRSSLKPLTQRQIAKDLQLDEGTVSRCVKTRSIQLPNKLYPLSEFFPAKMKPVPGTEAVGGDTDIAGVVIQEVIKEIVEDEDKHNPLSDERISQLLEQRGHKVARRTVAKYREKLHIPGSSERRI